MTPSLPTRPLALVTGASSGMGAVFARRLAAEGHDVALVARRRDRLQALADEMTALYGVQALVIPADLSTPAATPTIMAALGARPVAVLINAAGYSLVSDYAATPWADEEACVMTLVMAVCALTHAVLPSMLERRQGRIISISSLLALSQGGPGHTLYPASKSFVLKFMLSLDAEVRAQGVRITCVLPGSTASEFQTANGTAEAMKSMPASLISTPEAVVEASLKANAAGRVVVIPGWHNQLAAVFFRFAPDALVRWISASTARRFAKGH